MAMIPSTSRIEAFSDGVFAIVITLLVLGLGVPHIGKGASLTDQLRGLLTLAPQLGSIAVSFLMIAVFWVNHHHFFNTLQKSDRGLLWYNNIFLFWLALIPFPSAYIGEYPDHTVPVMLFGAIMCAAAVSFSLMRRHAHFIADLAHPGVTVAQKRKQYVRGFLGPILYLLAIPLALVSINLSKAIYLAVAIIYFLPEKYATE